MGKTPILPDPEASLFDGSVQGLLIALPENERPLQGLAGLIDWRLRGAISEFLRRGAITGKRGECVYLPISWHSRTLHLILAGIGPSSSPGTRERPPIETLHAIQKNVPTLRIEGLGASRSDFGDVDADYFVRHLKGAPVALLR